MKEKVIHQADEEETNDTEFMSLDSLSDDSRDDIEESKEMRVCYNYDDDDYNKGDGLGFGKLKLSASSVILENSIETASLTCDSLNSLDDSSLSTPSKYDIVFIPTPDETPTGSSNTGTTTTDDRFPSPELLRRRLQPLAPSPIHDDFYGVEDLSESTNNYGEKQEQWKNSKKDDNNTTRKKKLLPMLRGRRPKHLAFILLSLLMLFPFVAFIIGSRFDHYSWIKPIIRSDRPIWDSSQREQWEYFFKRKAPKVLRTIEAKAASNVYTLRLKASRLDFVMQSIDLHSSCPSVWEIQVDWSGLNHEQHVLPDTVQHHNNIKVVPIRKPSTNAVFLINDDIQLTCDEIERAFHEWQLDSSRMVGFLPFHHNEHFNTIQKNESQDRAHTSGAVNNAPYSMLSDRAAFVHKLYLTSLQTVSYTSQCQQLALSMIVSKITSKPPVAVKSNPQELRNSRINPSAAGEVESSRSDDGNNCHEWASMVGITNLPEEYSYYLGH